MSVTELKRISQKMGSDTGSGGMSDSAIVSRLDKLFKQGDSAYNGKYNSANDSGVSDTTQESDDDFVDELKSHTPDTVGTPHAGIMNVWNPVKEQILAEFPESEGCTPVMRWEFPFPAPIGPQVLDISHLDGWFLKAIRLLDYSAALGCFFLFFFGLHKVFSDLRSNQ